MLAQIYCFENHRIFKAINLELTQQVYLPIF